MQALEDRIKTSKDEMDIQDALEEIRDQNKKKGSLDTEDLIEEYAAKRRKLDGTEDAEEQARLDEEHQVAQAFAQADEEFVKKLVTESDSGSEAPRRNKRSLFSTASLLAPELPDAEADSSVALIGGVAFIKPKAKKAKKDKKDKKKDKKEKKDKKQKEGSNELAAATAVVPVADEEDSEDEWDSSHT